MITLFHIVSCIGLGTIIVSIQLDSWRAAIFITCDITLAMNCLIISAKFTILVFMMMTESFYLSGLEYGRLNLMLSRLCQPRTSVHGSKVQRTLLDESKVQSTNRGQTSFCRALANYRTRHTVNTQFIMYINSRLTSPAYFAYLAGNAFFHAYAIVYLSFQTVPHHVRSFIILILFIQTIPVGSIFVMVWLNGLINSSSRWLAPLLTRFNGNSIRMGFCREHWKTATHYEQLHKRKKPLALTAGILGKYTTMAFVKVCIPLRGPLANHDRDL